MNVKNQINLVNQSQKFQRNFRRISSCEEVDNEMNSLDEKKTDKKSVSGESNVLNKEHSILSKMYKSKDKEYSDKEFDMPFQLKLGARSKRQIPSSSHYKMSNQSGNHKSSSSVSRTAGENNRSTMSNPGVKNDLMIVKEVTLER